MVCRASWQQWPSDQGHGKTRFPYSALPKHHSPAIYGQIICEDLCLGFPKMTYLLEKTEVNWPSPWETLVLISKVLCKRLNSSIQNKSKRKIDLAQGQLCLAAPLPFCSHRERSPQGKCIQLGRGWDQFLLR